MLEPSLRQKKNNNSNKKKHDYFKENSKLSKPPDISVIKLGVKAFFFLICNSLTVLVISALPCFWAKVWKILHSYPHLLKYRNKIT